MVAVHFENMSGVISITQNLSINKNKGLAVLQIHQGGTLFFVLGCFGKEKLIVVKCFHSSIPPVCSQPSHVANGDGFWVEMCLIPGYCPATLCVVPVSRETWVVEWRPKPCMPQG